MKCLIGKPLGQLLQSAHVIAVIVGENQVVDLLDAGFVEHLGDPVGIAGAGVAGIHEQRLAGRRHVERGESALGVDEINIQRFAGLGLSVGQPREQDEGK